MKEEHDIHGFTKDDVVTVNKDTPRSAMHPNDFIAKKGERFVVIGHSGNELHPISIGRENDRAYRFAVSANEITQLPPARQEGETPTPMDGGTTFKTARELFLQTTLDNVREELSAKQAEVDMWKEIAEENQRESISKTEKINLRNRELESLKAAQGVVETSLVHENGEWWLGLWSDELSHTCAVRFVDGEWFDEEEEVSAPDYVMPLPTPPVERSVDGE